MGARGPKAQPGKRRKQSAEVARVRELRRLRNHAMRGGGPVPRVEVEQALNELLYYDLLWQRMLEGRGERYLRQGHADAALLEFQAARRQGAVTRKSADALGRERERSLEGHRERWRAETDALTRELVVGLMRAVQRAAPDDWPRIVAACRRELPALLGAPSALPAIDAEAVEEPAQRVPKRGKRLVEGPRTVRASGALPRRTAPD